MYPIFDHETAYSELDQWFGHWERKGVACDEIVKQIMQERQEIKDDLRRQND